MEVIAREESILPAFVSNPARPAVSGVAAGYAPLSWNRLEQATVGVISPLGGGEMRGPLTIAGLLVADVSPASSSQG